MTLTVEYGRLEVRCACGWTGTARDLTRAKATAARHVRECNPQVSITMDVSVR